MGKVTSSRDLIMLLLYAKGHSGQTCEPIRGRTRLMKMVFLFGKEVRRRFNLGKVIPEGALPEFTKYDYGPFSADVFADLEFLVELGFVQARTLGVPFPEEAQEYEYWQAGAVPEDDVSGPEAEEEFSLTPDGRGFVEDELWASLTEHQWAVLDDFKARCTSASLRSLLRYVYAKYPEMTTKSKIRQETLSKYEF